MGCCFVWGGVLTPAVGARRCMKGGERGIWMEQAVRRQQVTQQVVQQDEPLRLCRGHHECTLPLAPNPGVLPVQLTAIII